MLFRSGGKWWAGVGTAGILGALIWLTLRQDQVTSAMPANDKAQSAVAEIGKVLIADWVVPFEAMAVLLTAALIGAVVIALEEVLRRR